MSQVNIKKSDSFLSAGNDKRGLGFTLSGQLVIIKEDGSTISYDQSQASIVANKGVGLVADLPLVFNTGDIYVTTDTYKKYTALDSVSWSIIDLENSQFITDISQGAVSPPFYQFVSGQLALLTARAVTDSLDFSTITFDANGVSESVLESIYEFYYDANYIYMKRVDNKWIRSKIHKEVTPPGGLPE